MTATVMAPSAMAGGQDDPPPPLTQRGPDCRGNSDVLCFYDGGTNEFGQVAENNVHWNFGPGNDWQNRADLYWNTHWNQKACIYNSFHYGGTSIGIPPGGSYPAANFAASNKWFAPSASC